MRIAFISYEYPIETGGGGIGTFTYYTSKMMARGGHYVEVFSGSKDVTKSIQIEENLLVHLIKADRERFNQMVLPKFESRYKEVKFDVIESADYNADGFYIKKKFPEVPLLVRLHTPTWFINEMKYYSYLHSLTSIKQNSLELIKNVFQKTARATVHSFKRFLFFEKVRDEDIEYLFTKNADLIICPSTDLKKITIKRWGVGKSKIRVVPNVILPDKRLQVENPNLDSKTILFVGRLEYIKGILPFTEALTLFFKKNNDWRVIFVGDDTIGSPVRGLSIKKYILDRLNNYKERVVFKGKVELNVVYDEINKSELCVFPSIWDNFPYTCLEAMSAAKPIIGGHFGGMKEMFVDGESGIVVNSMKPREIYRALISLVDNKDLRVKLGEKARERCISLFTDNSLFSEYEKSYKDVIKCKPNR